MADSFNKKEREKKRKKRKQDKVEKREKNKTEGVKPLEFMYLDENGNLSPTPPDPKKKRIVSAEDISVSVPKQTDLDPADFVKNGIVKFYNPEKRFGFIRETNSNEDFFVHADSIEGEIKENDKVTFEVGSGPKGLVAINVKHAKKVTELKKPSNEDVAKATLKSDEEVD